MDMSRICDRYGFTVAFFHIQTRARLKPHKHVFWPRVFLALSEGIPITSPRKRPTETHGLNGVISTFNSWFLDPNPFFVHLTPEEFESAIISGHFGFEFEQISVREITWLSWCHPFSRFLQFRPSKSCRFQIAPPNCSFEERSRKARGRPPGVLPIMPFTGKLRPIGVSFSGFRYIKG